MKTLFWMQIMKTPHPRNSDRINSAFSNARKKKKKFFTSILEIVFEDLASYSFRTEIWLTWIYLVYLYHFLCIPTEDFWSPRTEGGLMSNTTSTKKDLSKNNKLEQGS